MKAKRIKAFLIDYLVISMYLVILLGINLLINPSVFEGGLQASQLQTHLIAFVSSVLPVVLVFSLLEARYKKTLGAHVMKITVQFDDNPYRRSLLRNALKFLPWQLGHTSAIYAIYSGADLVFYLITAFNALLMAVYLIGFFWRPPFLPDHIAKAEWKETEKPNTV